MEADGLFTIKDYYITFISDSTAALAALKNGHVDMLDYNYNLQTDVGSIDPSWGRVLNLQGCGRQEFGYNMESPIFGTGTDTPLGQQDSSRAAEAATDIRIAFDYAIPRQLIINNLLAGYGTPGVTPMLPTQPYYDSNVTARPYDLNQARTYLEAAGYSPPGAQAVGLSASIIPGNAVSIAGYYTDSTGAPISSRTIQLMETTDNSSYVTSTSIVGETTTDLTGYYSFVAAPTAIGTHYYYLLDTVALTGSNYVYLGTVMVSAAAAAVNLTPLYIIAIVAIILSLIAIAFALIRRK